MSTNPLNQLHHALFVSLVSLIALMVFVVSLAGDSKDSRWRLMSRHTLLSVAAGVALVAVTLAATVRCNFAQQRHSQASNGGVGMAIRSTEDGQIVVMALLAGGSASQAGITVGDTILAVNGQSVQGLSVEDVARRCAGPVGTTVKLRVRHPLGQEVDLVATRAKLKVPAGEPIPSSSADTLPTYHADRPTTGAAAKEAVPTPARVLRLRKISIMDAQGTRGEAYRMLIPVGWQAEGGILWHMDRTAAPADLIVRVRNPNGSEEFNYFPAQLFTWSPMLEQTLPPGQKAQGCEVVRPLNGPLAALQYVVVPRFRPELRNNYRVVAADELPRLAAAAAPMYQQPGMQGIVRAGRIRIEYPEGRRLMQEDLTCIFIAAQGPGGVTWGLDQITSSKAEKGQLDAEAALFELMAFSLRPTLQWFNEYETVTRMLIQGFYNDQAAIMQRVRIQTQANHAISDIIRRTYETRQATMDRIAETYDQKAIRGVQAHVNPFDGSTVEVPSEYEHTWTNALGEYIYTNDPNYNPNVGSNHDWRRMDRKN